LQGVDNPIVLLEGKGRLPETVAPGLRRLGSMLPTTPLHVLLLSLVDFPVIATSGNRGDEPIAIDEAGRDQLAADACLDHDRPIERRVDDSVIRVIGQEPMVMRLARGRAPCTLPHLEVWATKANVAIPPILAVGGQQKCALAVWTGTQAILGQHIGDMNDPETRHAFVDNVQDLQRLYGCDCGAIAHDLHPDYFTTHWARSAGDTAYPVQHHHAHAASCMVEHGLLDESVLAVVFDGTGFGTDETIWGGEILHATIGDFRRVASLDLFALPGGEAAIREPNRIALSLLAATFGPTNIPTWLLDRLSVSPEQARAWLRMMERGVNSPLTSSMGRLFDGVAALILQTTQVTYEGEAAILLESALDPEEAAHYPVEVHTDGTGVSRGDWRCLIRNLVEDISGGVSPGTCAARFHNAIAHWTASIAAASACEHIVLSGGCFQNAYLTTRIQDTLEALDKCAYVPSRIPTNDGGLAAGQLAVAMAHCHRQITENQSCASVFPAKSLIDCR
jgi:hydrogenase maturation protein HypF